MKKFYLITTMAILSVALSPLQSKAQTAYFTVDSFSACDSLTTMFYNQSSGTHTAKWFFGDGDSAVINNPVHTYLFAGVYTCVLEATDTLSGIVYKYARSMHVLAPTTVGFFGNPNPACPGEPVEFFNFSSNFFSSEWDFGDGSPKEDRTDPIHAFAAGGPYNVKLKVTGKCGMDSLINIHTIDPALNPFGGFGWAPFSPCPLEEVEFFNFGPQSQTTRWFFGDGDSSTLKDPRHTYATGGTKYITQIIKNDCGLTVTTLDSIFVNPANLPTLFLNITPDTACVGELVFFNSFSDNVVTWYFGDGDSASHPAPRHAYNSPGSYQVVLKETNSCGNSVNDTSGVIVQNNFIKASFIGFNPSSLVCPGDSFDVFPFGLTQDLVSWSWNMGDGSGSGSTESFRYAYDSLDVFAVTLITTNSCGAMDTIIDSLHIINTSFPFASFFPDPNRTCPYTPIEFLNFSNPGYYALWDFGDGDTSSQFQPVHTYANEGVYPISLFVRDGCNNIATSFFDVTISNGFDAVAYINFPFGRIPICKGDPVFMEAINSAISYKWYFGNGDSAITQDVQYVYPDTGTYIVTLIVTDSCGSDTVTDMVTVIPTPIANFSFACVCGTDSFNFTDLSTGGATAWLWDFGDGSFSNQQNPGHMFPADGIYNVSLDVFNGADCMNFTSMIVTVNPLISGTVFNGTTSDTIDNGYVLLYDYIAPPFRMLVVDSVLIGGGGNYSFNSVPPGSYLLYAHPNPVGFPLTIPSYHFNAIEWNAANILAVAGDSSGVDIIVHAFSTPAGNGFIGGKVLQGNINKMGPGDPFEGVSVSLKNKAGSVAVGNAVTDTGGNFSFSNLVTATYEIYVDVTGIPTDSNAYLLTVAANTITNILITVDSTNIRFDLDTGTATMSPARLQGSLRVYPNPYQGSTTIVYELSGSGFVELTAYNVAGDVIQILASEQQAAGIHQYSFSAASQGYGPGVYILKLNVAGKMLGHKLIELR